MNVPFIVFDETGEIVRTGHCPKGYEQAQATHPNHRVIKGEACDTTQHINLETLRPVSKNEFVYDVFDMTINANGVDYVGFNDIPVDCEVIVSCPRLYVRERVAVPAGENFEFATDYKGTYNLKFKAHGFKNYEVIINAI